MKKDYNIWAESKTINGYDSDLVLSMLQKCIRMADVEEACKAAYELYISGPIFLDKVWRRLMTISVEDIGFGNLDAPMIMKSLNDIRKEFPYDDGDQPIFFIHAIRVLCESDKDRSSDYLKNIIIKEAAMGKKIEIPDIAYDKHTKKGKKMGRGSIHFFEVATKVTPQIKVNNNYRERYGEILKIYDPEKGYEDIFKFSSGQY